MTGPKQKLPLLFAAGGVLALVVAIVGSILVFSDDDASETTEPRVEATERTPHHFARGPQPWPTEDAKAAVILFDQAGPRLALGPDLSIALTPSADGLKLEWSKESEAGRTVVVGAGTWRGHPVTARWTFAHGNPQAAFEFDVAGVEAGELTEAFSTRFELPAGDVRHVDDEMRYVPWVGEETILNAWTPLWLDWRGSQAAVSLHQGIFDQVLLTPAERGGVVLEVVWASDATRPRLAECAPEAPTTVGGRFTLTFGSATPTFTSRWPKGAEAVLSPVFERPEDHPEASVQQGKPTSGEDAYRRVTTIARGHSDLSDPRHGNGGLIGVGLGGSVVLPTALSEGEREKIRESFARTRLELGGRTEPTAFTGGACEAVVEALDADADIVVSGYETWDGTFSNFVSSSNAPTPQSGTLILPQLGGQRRSLTDQALGKLYIDRLAKERGAFLFSAPLLASRNPLVPAGKQGVLTPERNGHWTISEDLALVLADLELRVETEPLHVAGLGETVRHWRRARRSEIWFTPDGIVLHHGGEQPLGGLTIIAQGALDPNGPFVTGRDIRDARNAPQTWTWGTLEPNESTPLRYGESFAPPTPVEWVFESPVD